MNLKFVFYALGIEAASFFAPRAKKIQRIARPVGKRPKLRKVELIILSVLYFKSSQSFIAISLMILALLVAPFLRFFGIYEVLVIEVIMIFLLSFLLIKGKKELLKVMCYILEK